MSCPVLGQAPLHKCVVYGHGRCADLLLDAGADPDLPDARGRAPLHCAAAGERPDLVVLLLRRGADATRKDAKGRTPDGVLPPADRRTGKAKATMQLLLDAQVAAARNPPKKRTPKWRRR